jgi:hypothetical protein
VRTLAVVVGDRVSGGGTIVLEVFADGDGRVCDADDPGLATIEVHVRYPDGSEERTYLTRGW